MNIGGSNGHFIYVSDDKKKTVLLNEFTTPNGIELWEITGVGFEAEQAGENEIDPVCAYKDWQEDPRKYLFYTKERAEEEIRKYFDGKSMWK